MPKKPTAPEPTQPTMERVKLSSFRPATVNPNAGNANSVPMIVNSITMNGAGRPMLADRDGEMIAGSHSIQAFMDAGFDEAIVIKSDGTTPIIFQRTDVDIESAQGRSLQIGDNTIAVKSYQQDDILMAALLGNIAAEDARLVQAAGFEESDVRALMESIGQGEPAPDPGAQTDRASELAEEYGTALGQIWQLGRHRLAVGDCADKELVAALMQGTKADAVVTDPPYGQNQEGVTNDEPEKLTGILKGAIDNLPCDNAIVVAFQSPRTFTEWLDLIRKAGYSFERMLWMYKAAQMTFPWRGWLLKSEAILITSKGIGHWNDVHPYSHDCYYMSELSNELPENSGWHGSVKPLYVVSDLIQRVSESGHLIYDPFLGSGTTMIACEQTGRTCYAVEIEPKYAAVAIQRWEALTSQHAERINDR